EVKRPLQVALLSGREHAIEDDEVHVILLRTLGQSVNNAPAHIERGIGSVDADDFCIHDLQIDGGGKADRLLQARRRAARGPATWAGLYRWMHDIGAPARRLGGGCQGLARAHLLASPFLKPPRLPCEAAQRAGSALKAGPWRSHGCKRAARGRRVAAARRNRRTRSRCPEACRRSRGIWWPESCSFWCG